MATVSLGPKLLPDTRIVLPTEPLVGETKAEGKGVGGIAVLVGVLGGWVDAKGKEPGWALARLK